MQYGGYGRKYRVKPRFYVIIALLIGLSAWGLAAIFGLLNQPRIEWGRLSSNKPVSAIVLRDEMVVESQEFAKISCIATEGGAVAKGDPVAMQYLTGFSETDIAKLAKMQSDIKDYQENNILKDVKDKDLTLLNGKIDTAMKQLSDQAISRQTQTIALTEQELKSLMAQRKAYLLTAVKADEPLNRLYALEASLVDKINRTRKILPASADGLVSYYLDGYEGTLTVASIDKMTPGTMSALMNEISRNRKPFKSAETVLKGQPVCRIVNAGKWYAVIVMNASENPLIEGIDADVTFDGLQSAVTAKVLKVAKEGRNSIAVLEVPQGVAGMLSLRLVNGHLGQDIEGLLVPLNMVREENGRAYIKIQGSGANEQTVEVKILGRDEKNAIIEEATPTGLLQPNLPLAKP